MTQFQDVFGVLSPLIRGVVVAVRLAPFPHLPCLPFFLYLAHTWLSQIILVPSGVTGVLAGTVSDKLSRKYTISLGSAIFAVGSAISAASKTSLGVLILGRCIAGTGEGLFLGCLGVYLCEISPRHLRSQMLLLQQLVCTGGIAFAFFFCFGTYFPPEHTSKPLTVLFSRQVPPKSTVRWRGGSPSSCRRSLRPQWPCWLPSSRTLPA